MSSAGPRPQAQRGYTLVELLATAAVAGVSLSLVVPSLGSLGRSNQRAGAINELVATLHIARSEAVTRHAPVAVCPSRDGRRCDESRWDEGWIRFVDSNANYRADPGEEILGETPAIAGPRISTEAFAQALAFQPSGQVRSPAAGQPGGDFLFCSDAAPAEAQVVVLTGLGLPVLARRRADGRDADCSLG